MRRQFLRGGFPLEEERIRNLYKETECSVLREAIGDGDAPPKQTEIREPTPNEPAQPPSPENPFETWVKKIVAETIREALQGQNALDLLRYYREANEGMRGVQRDIRTLAEELRERSVSKTEEVKKEETAVTGVQLLLIPVLPREKGAHRDLQDLRERIDGVVNDIIAYSNLAEGEEEREQVRKALLEPLKRLWMAIETFDKEFPSELKRILDDYRQILWNNTERKDG
ncbi:MAG: hypothetical protein Q8P01_03205 [bacterium]|nr:hypothetical protein [bacterium]